MNTLKCIIVDDEPLALDLIEAYVRQTPFLQLVAKCANVFEAMESINRHEVDLVFLDIQMPGMNGMSFSKTIRNNQRIIFTTAYEKYALEGYKVDALDFLLKPFNYEEFLNAVNKAKDWFDLVKGNKREDPAPYIFVRSDYKQLKIMLADILYVEGLKDYIKIWLAGDAKPIMSLMNLGAFGEQVQASGKFMRIHRSYIIALDKIDFIERSQVIINDARINVGDQYKEQFQAYLSGKSIL